MKTPAYTRISIRSWAWVKRARQRSNGASARVSWRAINAHNKAAGRVLSTPYFAQQEEGVVDSMFEGTRISNLRIDAPIPDNGYKSPDGKRYQEAVNVPVKFALQQREEVSMPNGHTAWGYTLVRTASDQPWRINDHGVG
ncbi:DUF4829 domain-containing protein [Actinomadura formosensis]|uniref:DUF4829 domain-containing protein n=1 Tax=Actinomadura formosensis TaxID=60706 RepID=UPI001F5FDAFA|nr:DUF4829 domain-containing protein [Actinomadura formosensis]